MSACSVKGGNPCRTVATPSPENCLSRWGKPGTYLCSTHQTPAHHCLRAPWSPGALIPSPDWEWWDMVFPEQRDVNQILVYNAVDWEEQVRGAWWLAQALEKMQQEEEGEPRAPTRMQATLRWGSHTGCCCYRPIWGAHRWRPRRRYLQYSSHRRGPPIPAGTVTPLEVMLQMSVAQARPIECQNILTRCYMKHQHLRKVGLHVIKNY